MTPRSLLLVVAVITACALAWSLRPEGSPAPLSVAAGSESPRAAGSDALVPPRQQVLAAQSEPSAVAAPPAYLRAARAQGATELRAEQDVLYVDGIALFGKDVVAFRRGERAKGMSAEMYAFLLQGAVERQLTLAAARAQNIELSQAQEQQLAAVRAQAAERAGTALGARESDEIELEARTAQAELLQGELLRRSGTPIPSPTDADVQRFVAEHAAELGKLPTAEPARSEILRQIRARLMTEQQAAWARARTELLARLTAAAVIVEDLDE